MVEKLVSSSSEANNAVPCLDSHSIKAMSKAGRVSAPEHDTETNGDEPDSESGTTQGESEDDNNGDKNVSGGSRNGHLSNSVPRAASARSVRSSGNRDRKNKPEQKKQQEQGAKMDNERVTPTGTSSDNSIKTTPDSILDPPSLNCELNT